jgi:hypothetical protein
MAESKPTPLLVLVEQLQAEERLLDGKCSDIIPATLARVRREIEPTARAIEEAVEGLAKKWRQLSSESHTTVSLSVNAPDQPCCCERCAAELEQTLGPLLKGVKG